MALLMPLALVLLVLNKLNKGNGLAVALINTYKDEKTGIFLHIHFAVFCGL